MKKIFTFLLVALSSMAVNAQSINGDFEAWRTYTVGISSTSLESVRGWHCPDSIIYLFGPIIAPGGKYHRQLFKTTDNHSGQYAAKLVTADEDTLGMLPGIMTNAAINVDISAGDFSLSGGTPVAGRVNYVNAWIKCAPQGDDSASIVATAIITGGASDGTDSVLGFAFQSFGAISSYTLVSMPITYDDPSAVPDAIQVVFTSSGGNPVDASTLYVDDVSYTLFPASVDNVYGANKGIVCYPNPANNTLFIKGPAMHLNWQAVDMNGKTVATASFNGSKQIDVTALAPGMYFYTVTDDKGVVINKNKFSINR